MRKRLCILLLLTAIFNISAQTGMIKYSVPNEPWGDFYGNHRAIIRVDKPSDAVLVDFLWRRHDLDPELRKMLIVNSETGEEIKNVYRVIIDKERCKLVFGPVSAAGTYYFYYLPGTPPPTGAPAGSRGRGSRGYAPPENAPDIKWVTNHQLSGSEYKNVTTSLVTEIQARTKFESFYPMEVVATAAELKNYLTKYNDEYLVFPEDRFYPIRMQDALPLRWISKTPGGALSGKAMKNEYYAMQVGIYASQKPLQNLKLEFSDLKNKSGNIIPAKALTCYNTDGVDINGNPFTLKVDVKQGRVQPMWFGVDIAPDAVPGTYEGTVIVKPENSREWPINVSLVIENNSLSDRGDGETWRHSRLRWLNSTLGIDYEPVASYTPLVIDNRRISCLGRTVQLNNFGLPETITCWGNNILASPIKFVIQVNNRVVTFPEGKFTYKLKKKGFASWESVSENGDFILSCKGEMEFDGHMNYKYEVKSKTGQRVQDIRLEIPMKKEFATYMVGMGRLGGFTPEHHISRWLRTEDSFWIGETNGGIHCELRGSTYNGPMINLYQSWIARPNLPTASWANGGGSQNIGHGGFRIDTEGNTVTASAFSNLRRMAEGQSVKFEFAFLITPVKELDTKSQFSNRYFHATNPTPEVIAHGGNVMNVHHANKYNPYINYPFIAQKEMRDLVDEWHNKGWKVKIYYTLRELSNRMTEIWALRSLGFEILSDGNGGGDRWLREHLVTNYTPQWYAYLGNGEDDEAVLNSGESRWYNYYVEGLHWLVKNMDIDGLYLDDVSFDRRTLKRMRKVMEMVKPGCMIDLHSNTTFSIGPVNQYLEFYPYVDRTWYGEGFPYDISPADFWLTETSGIPFGVMNDILLDVGINTHRGMLYGMTIRRGNAWTMWKLWDEFGIKDSKMIGYWDKKPVVTTDKKEVYATTYLRNNGKALIEIASWIREPVNVKMNIDWQQLGLKPSEAKIVAPEIQDYQTGRSFNLDEPIPVDALSDIILIVSKK